MAPRKLLHEPSAPTSLFEDFSAPPPPKRVFGRVEYGCELGGTRCDGMYVASESNSPALDAFGRSKPFRFCFLLLLVRQGFLPKEKWCHKIVVFFSNVQWLRAISLPLCPWNGFFVDVAVVLLRCFINHIPAARILKICLAWFFRGCNC